MTDEQRDELLINLAKTVNIIQENLIEFRKELKQDIEDTKLELGNRIDAVAEGLKQTRYDLKQTQKDLKQTQYDLNQTKIDLSHTIKNTVDSAVEVIIHNRGKYDLLYKKVKNNEIERKTSLKNKVN